MIFPLGLKTMNARILAFMRKAILFNNFDGENSYIEDYLIKESFPVRKH